MSDAKSRNGVFLSYGRGDDEAFVKTIHADLTGAGMRAWYDRVDLPARGEAFTAEIARAIETSERLILFIGAHSASSEWCQREWMHALRHCIPVVPVLVQHTFATLPAEIRDKFPESIFSVNGLELPPELRSDAPQKLRDLLNTEPLLPLATAHGASSLRYYYIERPQYLNQLKDQLGIGDPTKPGRTRIVGITSRQETATLEGIGGIGKTTLALALCADCNVRRTFEHIFFVNVGPDTTAEDIPALMFSIALTLQPGLEPYRNLNEARIHLSGLLSRFCTLIVLDDVWAEGIVEGFSFSGIDCRLLVTTRNRALVDGGTMVDRLRSDEGLALIGNILQVSVDALPDACPQIVTVLDGHTLAVQIAGSWLKKFGLGRAEKYLDDLQGESRFEHLQLSRSDRNKNLSLSLGLSYEALEEADKARFRATGIFATGSTFDLAALAEIWGLKDEDAALYPAGALVDLSLLDYDPATERYEQHPLLRAYARTLLVQTGEFDRIFDRYADCFTARAHKVYVGLQDNPEEWQAHAAELPDIAALGDALMVRTENGKSGDLERAIRFVFSTGKYVTLHMEVHKWPWLEMGINAVHVLQSSKPDDKLLMARESQLLNQLGLVWDNLGNAQKALEYFDQALHLFQALNDKSGEAATLNNIGSGWSALGNARQALEYYNQALPLSRLAGDRRGEASSLNNIGHMWAKLGELHKALKYYEQALPVRREVNDRRGEAVTLNNIGLVWQTLGEPHKALSYYKQALSLRRVVNDQGGEANTLSSIGMTWQTLGELHKALQYYEQSLALSHAVGDRESEAATLVNIGAIYFNQGDIGKALEIQEKSIHIVRELGYVAMESSILYNSAILYRHLRHITVAMRYAEAGRNILIQYDLPQATNGTTVAEFNQLLLQLKFEAASPMDQGAEVGQVLAQVYTDEGANGVREMLANHMTDEVIEQLIAQLEANLSMDSAQTGQTMILPQEAIQRLTENTQIVMTEIPEKREYWRQHMAGQRADWAERGAEYATEVAFADALLAILDGQTPVLRDDNPYAGVVRQVVEAIAGYTPS